ncbi:hypothetical protein DPMN_004538 [Dreissena polymorpha]|uniref:Uncharacterized protein n=1 Tax=Dreissena polymorpha TaxID=45954 RepID=A0A9D4RTM6_DREPO|nr:hypothetical protein DPMN_004538 [Dreissena polymorpha]
MCSKNFVSNQEAFGIECRLSCPDGKLLFNQTCLKKCPEEAKYNFDGVCLTECPPESPYSVIDMANRCVERCYYDTLYLNSQCVPRYQCNDSMIEFEGLCLELCPEGYRSFSGECLKDINVIAALLVILAILVTGCGYTRKIIVDYGRVCRFMCTRGIFESQSFLTILEESGAVHLEINTDTPRAFEHENVIDEEITLL